MTYGYQEHFVRTMLAAQERAWGIPNPYKGKPLPPDALMDSEERDADDAERRQNANDADGGHDDVVHQPYPEWVGPPYPEWGGRA